MPANLPLFQGEKVISSGLGGVPALYGRGGGAQHKQRILLGAAVLGHIPGMIPDHALRLVAAFLLLIQNDQTKILHRSENSGTGADDHPGQPVPDPFPFIVPLTGVSAISGTRTMTPLPRSRASRIKWR